jgi:nucleotide-binding universal stress UspA family protein
MEVVTVFRTLLVPLDGTADGESALSIASSIATALGAKIWLLRVLPGNDITRDDVNSGCAYLDRLARRLAEAGVSAGTQVRTGPVADGVMAARELLAADLVLVAASCDAARDILSRSRVPVVLVQSDVPATSKLERLLVPVDGSVGAALALGTAAELAQRSNAKLVLLSVAMPIPTWIFDNRSGVELGAYVNPEWDSAALAGAQRHVDRLARQLELDDLRVEATAVLGGAAESIVQTAAHAAADMIVMGTDSYRGSVRADGGSVADSVVQTAAVPVLLVRPETTAEAPVDSSGDSIASTRQTAVLVRG